jgi:iron complex transport system substrate-binding protein
MSGALQTEEKHKSVHKIVSLLPSTTELVCALGLEKKLVAISHECDFPASIKSIPRITGSIIPPMLSQKEINNFVSKAVESGQSLYTVDVSMLNKLSPDLILTQGLCDVCAVTSDTLEASLRGVDCQFPASCSLLSLEGMSFEGIYNDLIQIAVQTGTLPQANQLISDAKNRVLSLKPKGPPPRLLALEWIEPFFSAGHWVPEQINIAGAVACLSSAGHPSKRLSLEELVSTLPEVIIVLCCGYDLDENSDFAQALYKIQSLESAPAIQNQQVWALDANSLCSRQTLRVVDGAEVMHDILWEPQSVCPLSARRIYPSG